MRFRVAAVSLVAVFGLALAWIAAAPADNPVLLGSVGPGFVISLTDAAGNDVKHLDAGTYTIKVDDKADIHNFHLTGPGVDVTTTVEFVGQMEWSVTVKDGAIEFDFAGTSKQVRGPLNIARPIQGWPVMVQAGADAGATLAAERNRREWTVWVLLGLFLVACGEAAWAWYSAGSIGTKPG